MGYTVFAGRDQGSDIWQTAVQVSALRGALQEKCGEQATRVDVVCCASVNAPVGSPVVKVVQTNDGSACEVVAGGEANKFYTFDEIVAQLDVSAGGSTPSKVTKGAAPQEAAPAAPAPGGATAKAGAALSGDKDYVLVLSGSCKCDPWVAAVETAQLRQCIQEITGGSLPAVVSQAAAPAGVSIVTEDGQVVCGGASIAEVQAGFCGGDRKVAAPAPAVAAAAPTTAVAAAPPPPTTSPATTRAPPPAPVAEATRKPAAESPPASRTLAEPAPEEPNVTRPDESLAPQGGWFLFRWFTAIVRKATWFVRRWAGFAPLLFSP
mmetsp:Transcript_99630/g.316261  ORF Transcript_99630/g.316261 Transcript_99630/m.316261 type:complete len:321 (-) Transcript_99630:72-1034(-)